MQEIFVDIKDYEGLYQLSNLGEVKSFERTPSFSSSWIFQKKEKILKHSLRSGYPYVTLCKNGIKKTHNIHRLLGIYFIPNPENHPVVRHLNDVKTDLRIENLAWGTVSDNSKDLYINGYKNSDNQVAYAKSGKAASKIVLNTQTGIFYDSAKDAANAFGLNYLTLMKRLSGNYKNNTSLIYV